MALIWPFVVHLLIFRPPVKPRYCRWRRVLCAQEGAVENRLVLDDSIFPSVCGRACVKDRAVSKDPLHVSSSTYGNYHRRRLLVSSAIWLSALTDTRQAKARNLPTETTENAIVPDDDILNTLVYQSKLGKGSYKTVYAVQSPLVPNQQWALSVQRLRVKSDIRDAMQGIRVAHELDTLLSPDDDIALRSKFEQVISWWAQPSSPNEFEKGALVLRSDSLSQRTQKVPKTFRGSLYLISIKPLYDMDLKRFAMSTPVVYPTGELSRRDEPCRVVGGLEISEQGALQLTRDVCVAGRCMETIGLVHRDIKPKNVMLSKGRAVVIDFGFAEVVGPPKRQNDRCCIVEPGKIKGEVDYVLAQDVFNYQGCQEGDRYAVAKTLYETIFAASILDSDAKGSSVRHDIAEWRRRAQQKNEDFVNLLESKDAFANSRFPLSFQGCSILADVIRGLGDTNRARQMSFSSAVKLLDECSLLKEHHAKSSA